MASVIINGCTKCKKCVEVCPVEAFHEDDEMLVINPDVCLDCGACIPVCPVNVIYAQEDLPDDVKYFTQHNHKKSKILPVILEKN